MYFRDLFDYFYFFLLSICLLTGLWSWQKLRKAFRLLVMFVLATIVVEAAAIWTLKSFGQNNAVYIVYDLLNMAVVGGLMRSFMVGSFIRRISLTVIVSAIVTYMVDVFILNRYVADYSYINCGICIFFCFLSCLYLLGVMQNPSERGLLTLPEFILAIFVLFFYSISLLYWLVFLRLTGTEARELTRLLYRLFLISNLIFYSGILIVFILERKASLRKHEGKFI